MATEKRAEDMTVAETMDAIFGEGTAEQAWSGEDLEIARRSYEAPGRLGRQQYELFSAATGEHGGQFAWADLSAAMKDEIIRHPDANEWYFGDTGVRVLPD